MPRRRVAVLALTLGALLALVLAGPAAATKRKVPFGFFGAVVPVDMYQPANLSDASLDQQMGVMARSGVESVRLSPDWRLLEPQQGVFTFSLLDRLVSAAARHGLSSVVNVTGTPQWIAENPGAIDYWREAPRDPAPFAELMRQLVLRYGPAGGLWSENPGLPRQPVRQWQIWNEENAPWYWRHQPWGPSYAPLLKGAYRVIHGLDRKATVIAGSFVASSATYTQWDAVRDLYKAGAKKYFDAVSIHPFTNDRRSVKNTVSRTLLILQRVRDEMKKRGDRKKPIYTTEIMWSASDGKIPAAGRLGFETTAKGQSQRLTAVWGALARERRALGLGPVFWYAWASEYDPNEDRSTVSFRYTGLNRWAKGGAFSTMPILKTYTKAAVAQEGCRKGSDARRCGG